MKTKMHTFKIDKNNGMFDVIIVKVTPSTTQGNFLGMWNANVNSCKYRLSALSYKIAIEKAYTKYIAENRNNDRAYYFDFQKIAM